MATAPTSGRVGTPTTLQRVAQLISASFVLVGVLGFIPGITTDYGQMELAGPESTAQLLAVFQVSVLHNLFHLAFGVVGFALSRTHAGARQFLLVGGAVYLVLFLYGLAVDKSSDANIIPLNSADDALHLFLGLAMLGAGLLLGKTAAGTRR